MERQSAIETIKNAIDGKSVGFTEMENWFYTSSEGAFIVDLGFLKLDCRAIEISEDHIGFDYVGCRAIKGRNKQIKFPLEFLMKLNVSWVRYF